MKIIFIADAEQEEEIRSKKTNSGVEVNFKTGIPEAEELEQFDVIFILNQPLNAIKIEKLGKKPVFINSVPDTLSKLLLPKNVGRINAWRGFLKRDIWEVVSQDRNGTEAIFTGLGWKIIMVKDEPGFVAARVVSMIINEAFFAIGEKVSSKEEIDIAMKMGTNYPLGPFEWGEYIGLRNIYNLLKILSKKDLRYSPATALENSI